MVSFSGRTGRSSRTVLVAAAAASIALLGTACQPPPPAPTKDTIPANGGANDPGWFQGGYGWQGDFGDPHVVNVNGTYYAYSSPTGGRYLPVLTSTDLKNWTIHRNWSAAGPPNAPGYNVNTDPAIPAEIRSTSMGAWDKYNMNDGLVAAPAWALPNPNTGPWVNRDYWAPGVIQIGATWYSYGAVRVGWQSDDPNGYGRFCLTVASAPSPLGPFRDVSGGGPIQCQPVEADPAGSIDPFPYRDPTTGKHFLLWKAAGKVGHHESAIMSVELGVDGRPVPGAPWVKLLQTNRADAWEGGTIENPGMVHFAGITYLFYSANDSNTGAYATGYAACVNGPAQPCVRFQNTPLIASSGAVQGPGGSAPFIASDGSLKVAYASFWQGETRTSKPRRLHIGKVQLAENWRLTFAGDV